MTRSYRLAAAVTAAAAVLATMSSAATASAAAQCGSLQAGETLTRGQQVDSCDGAFKWVMQNDGNFVEYRNVDGVAVWSSNTGDGDHVTFQGDGNLVVYAGGNGRFATNSGGLVNGTVAFQNDGNLVVYRDNGTVAYSNGKRLPYTSSVIGRWSDNAGTAVKSIGADGFVTSYCTQSLYLDAQGGGVFTGRMSAGGCWQGKPTGSYEEKWTISGDSASVFWKNFSGLESDNYKTTTGSRSYTRIRF
ncbi:hypothetical protein [Amycolatopsis sp. NPDC004378]